MLNAPSEFSGLPLIASVSGGKDSTALMLALREAGLEFRAVFADTAWEAPETYAYLDLLRARLGITIDVVGAPGGMVERTRYRAGFPSRLQRWCTRELKLEPLRAYHDRIAAELGTETVCVVGVRAQESAARAEMPEIEDEPAGHRSWGGWIWRPLIRWTLEDVLRIHSRHGVPVNPLYHRGFNRVGCWPCIMSSKEEIRTFADYAPERVREIAELERQIAAERNTRTVEMPGRYSSSVPTFFQVRHGIKPLSIESVIEWSRTSRGGRQLPLLVDPPTGGCMRWGLCDAPSEASDEPEVR